MELLDRYLEAVRKHLPWKRQDDILAELRANLEAQLEDKEQELGRPLSKEEAEAWLKQVGSPMQVAAPYLPQQYLIGPRIFPMYWFVLRTVFLWATVIYAIVAVSLIFTSGKADASSVAEAIVRWPVVLMNAAAWVTLIFVAIEFAVTHYPERCPTISGVTADWSPSSLPPVVVKQTDGTKPRSYLHAVAEALFGLLALAWLLLVPQHPYLLFGPGSYYLQSLPYQRMPVWIGFYWWVVALSVFQLIWQWTDLWSGHWQEPARARQIVFHAVGLIPLVVLLSAPGRLYITLKHPALDMEKYGGSMYTINESIHKAVFVICLIVVVQLIVELGKLAVDVYRGRLASEH
jgi:hypothetical protein